MQNFEKKEVTVLFGSEIYTSTVQIPKKMTPLFDR